LDDLGIKLPSLQVSLADLGHPLLHKANDLLADGVDSLEPVLSIDDVPMKKVQGAGSPGGSVPR
jgi:hypothetical protein